jgi:hypothetical protein
MRSIVYSCVVGIAFGASEYIFEVATGHSLSPFIAFPLGFVVRDIWYREFARP